jgi:hypothetical protein
MSRNPVKITWLEKPHIFYREEFAQGIGGFAQWVCFGHTRSFYLIMAKRTYDACSSNISAAYHTACVGVSRSAWRLTDQPVKFTEVMEITRKRRVAIRCREYIQNYSLVIQYEAAIKIGEALGVDFTKE